VAPLEWRLESPALSLRGSCGKNHEDYATWNFIYTHRCPRNLRSLDGRGYCRMKPVCSDGVLMIAVEGIMAGCA